jgi:hypothetical protein
MRASRGRCYTVNSVLERDDVCTVLHAEIRDEYKMATSLAMAHYLILALGLSSSQFAVTVDHHKDFHSAA